ncbi:MAG TPA: glycosyltransferase [candidate division Zixibacteria bacterium]|nr:glycosyltransferase [candidate division Zixibacteria bacterium]
MTRVSGAPLRLTYLHGRYPVLTETFIDREIQGLLDRGVDLEIVSIRPPDDRLSPAQQALRERVTYLLPASVGKVLAANAWALFRHPRTYVSTLVWLLTRDHGGEPRYRTALHFEAGVYAAWVLRNRAGVHIHAHFVDRAATVALVAARFLGTTYSVTAHAREIYVKPVLLAERIGQAAFAVTCTEYNRAHLERELGTDVTSRLIRLYHGIPMETYANRDGRQLVEPPLILSVAQLWERKGLRYLIEACALLRDRGTAFCCEIVGDGPQRGELQARIDHHRLGAQVTITGPMPHPEVLERYRRAAVFVLPCVVTDEGDRDGIPNVILEALASSLPVVTTMVSGIPEVVRDGETGRAVPERDPEALADAIAAILAEPAAALAMAERGRRLVESEFDVDRNVDRLVERFVAADGSQR